MKNKFYVQIGSVIRELREENNLTREELAEKVNISTKFLYEIEYGKKGHSSFIFISLIRELLASRYNGTFKKSSVNKNDNFEDIFQNLINIIINS